MIAITVRIFRSRREDDIIKWQDQTKGNLALYYRDGAIHFGWLHLWELCGEWTKRSTFAKTSTSANGILIPTGSWQVIWRNIPADDKFFQRFSDNEHVVQAFDELYADLHAKPLYMSVM